jgi:triosephosphate isomerase
MKKMIIVANFKSHKNRVEIERWMEIFEDRIKKQPIDESKLAIIAPPMPSIMFVSNRLLGQRDHMHLAVQNISPFSAGAYTGAVCGENLEGYNVKYAIIGHSERRKFFCEDEEMLNNQVIEAKIHSIEPIYCVQGAETIIPKEVKIVAYEPVFAIGSGHPDTPENANIVAEKLMERGAETVLYGGSVTDENVHQFTQLDHIQGVLVGGASLEPEVFANIIENA